MAFDLKKSGEEKKKFDLSKSEESDLGSTKNSGDNSNSGNGNGNKKKSTWIFVVIGVAIVGSCIWYFSSKKDTNLAPEQLTSVVASNDSTTIPASTINDTTSSKVDSSQVSQKQVKSEKVIESSQRITKPSVSNNKQISSLDQSTLEEKAKQVINGNFGNGLERKNALGSEYKEIQKKVNEMYHKS